MAFLLSNILAPIIFISINDTKNDGTATNET